MDLGDNKNLNNMHRKSKSGNSFSKKFNSVFKTKADATLVKGSWDAAGGNIKDKGLWKAKLFTDIGKAVGGAIAKKAGGLGGGENEEQEA